MVDGEGSVGYFSCGVNRNHRFVIEIKMTCEPIIDWLQETYGGYKQYRQSTNPNHKDQWRWRVQGNKAIELYEELKPLLKLKIIEYK